MGFIEEYSSFILEHIPTHPLWAESCGLAILGTTLGADRVFTTKWGELRLNLYFVYVGPSGIARKSLPLRNFVVPLLDAIPPPPDYEEVKPSKKKKRISRFSLIIPSSYSIEGMHEYLSLYGATGCIVQDELTMIFKQSMGKDYLRELMEFVSQLYDGRVMKRYTRSTKLEMVQKCHVSMLSTTTPYIYRVMRPDFFIQGTGNRMLFILANIDDYKMDVDKDFLGYKDWSIVIQKIQYFAQHLTSLRDGNLVFGGVNYEADKILQDYFKQLRKEVLNLYKEDSNDWTPTYIDRLRAFTLKLAALKAFSDGWKTVPIAEGHNLIIVDEQQAQWAINRSNQHYEFFKQMLDDWRSIEESIPLRTARDPLEYVYRVIDQAGKEGIPRTQLLKKTNFTAQQLTRYLATLIQSDRVKQDTVKSSRGRGTVKYWALKTS